MLEYSRITAVKKSHIASSRISKSNRSKNDSRLPSQTEENDGKSVVFKMKRLNTKDDTGTNASKTKENLQKTAKKDSSTE